MGLFRGLAERGAVVRSVMPTQTGNCEQEVIVDVPAAECRAALAVLQSMPGLVRLRSRRAGSGAVIAAVFAATE